jgi:hypothetical protein
MFNNVTWAGGCAVSLTFLALMTSAGAALLARRALKLKDA